MYLDIVVTHMHMPNSTFAILIEYHQSVAVATSIYTLANMHITCELLQLSMDAPHHHKVSNALCRSISLHD